MCSFAQLCNMFQINAVFNQGDEVEALGDNWMFFIWCSDLSPAHTHSPASRFPICIVPASLYVHSDGVNITYEAITQAVTSSFNKLSCAGISIRDFDSCGSDEVTW